MSTATSAAPLSALQDFRPQLRAAFEDAFAAVATARQHNLVDDAKVRRIRAAFKAGARQKVQSIEKAKMLLRIYTAIKAEMEALVEGAGFPAGNARPEIVAPTRHGDTLSPASSCDRPPTPLDDVWSAPRVVTSNRIDDIVDEALRECAPQCARAPRPPIPDRKRAKPRKSENEADAAEMAARKKARYDRTLAAMKVAGAIVHNRSNARDALRTAGIDVTASARRAATRWARQLLEHESLDDRRRRNGAKVSVLTPEMCELIEYFTLEFPTANARALQQCIAAHLHREYEAAMGRQESGRPDGSFLDWDAPIPSTQSIRRAIAKLGKTAAIERAQGSQRAVALTRPTKGEILATRPNERWEMDNSHLDAWVQEEVNGELRQMPVWITAIIDVFTRAIMAFVVSTGTPDSVTVAMALRKAMRPRKSEHGVEPFGVPQLLVVDNGGEFSSEQTEMFCARAGITLERTPPHSPNSKAHIERFFGTLKRQLVARIPGAKGGKEHGDEWSPQRIRRLPAIEWVRDEVQRWIDTEYHRTIHSGTAETPVARWRRTASVQSRKVRTRDLDALLLFRTRRVITRGLVKLTVPGRPRARYYAPDLLYMIGEEVVIRHNPDDIESVYAYDRTDTVFLGELWNVDVPNPRVQHREIIDAWVAQRARVRDRRESLTQRLQQSIADAEAGDRDRERRRLAALRATDAESRKAVALQQQLHDAEAADKAAAIAAHRTLSVATEELRQQLSASSPVVMPASPSAASANATNGNAITRHSAATRPAGGPTVQQLIDELSA